MEDPRPIESKSSATKTIRLTRAEVYAMRLPSPRKKRIAFGLVGLLIIAILGNVLWFFQDVWLPYWFPPEASSPTEIATPASGSDPIAPAPPRTPAFTPDVEEEASLDFLSAALWDNPRFLQGVRTFNQALDRYRRFLNDRTQAPLLPQIEAGATEASNIFESLRAEAPEPVPMTAYIGRCRKLLAELEELRQPSVPAVAETPREATADELRRHPDYREGARLFNQAVEQFNQYKANTSRTELLGPIEDLARQAGETFEALKRRAPATSHEELDRLIHQSYGLVSACRGARLQAGESRSEPAAPLPPAGTTRRRPALPAYQSSP